MTEVQTRRHIIRRARMEDIPLIMDFLDRHWEKGCLMSRDRAFFEYEHVIGGEVNFIVAGHRDTGSIDAVQGFIPCSRNEGFDYFGVFWIAKRASGTPLLGMEIAENAHRFHQGRYSFGVGLRADTAVRVVSGNYQDMVGKLHQYYRLNPDARHKIAVIHKNRTAEPADCDRKLIPLPNMDAVRRAFDMDLLKGALPYKDAWYMEHRYFRHPYFTFNFWGIEEHPGEIGAVIVGRVAEQNGSKALRVVDLFGPSEALMGIGAELDIIMRHNAIEYTDFYCYGIADEIMRAAGFVLRDEEDPNVIPDFFEPFEQKNVDIFFGSYVHEGFRLFKGDADQGRPRRLRLPMEWKP